MLSQFRLQIVAYVLSCIAVSKIILMTTEFIGKKRLKD